MKVIKEKSASKKFSAEPTNVPAIKIKNKKHKILRHQQIIMDGN